MQMLESETKTKILEENSVLTKGLELETLTAFSRRFYLKFFHQLVFVAGKS